MKCDAIKLKELYDHALVKHDRNPIDQPASFFLDLRPFFEEMGFDAVPFLRFPTEKGGSVEIPVCVREKDKPVTIDEGCKVVGVAFKRNIWKELAPKTVPRGKVSQLEKHMKATGADVGFAIGEVRKRPYESDVDLVHVFKKRKVGDVSFPVKQVTVPFGRISTDAVKEICDVMEIKK